MFRSFLSAVSACRSHLLVFLSAHLQDLLMREARRSGGCARSPSSPGALFTFSVLCSERLTRLEACRSGEGEERLRPPSPEEGEGEEQGAAAITCWEPFLSSPMGGGLLLDCLSQLSGLSSLTLHRVCTNEMLFVVADSCPRLQCLDVSHSAGVTDLGLVHLGGVDQGGHHHYQEKYLPKPRKGCRYLRELRFNPQGQGSEPIMPR